MKTVFRISVMAGILGAMMLADIPQLPVQLVPDAEAIFGVRRRAFRRGVILGAAAGGTWGAGAHYSAAAQQQSATAQQQSATAQQQSATAQQQSATAQQQAAGATPPSPPPAAEGKPLPIGTVVHALPGGCTSTPVGGVEYYYCGGNFYRAVFQGNQLVYVTAKP
jgi:pyruvate/2-oxoglutarate dehydrogenase complex dihydrolipoamide acyltransferase (E2) component